MTRANTHPIHVTDAFKTATINTIKKILSSNTIIRHNNYDKNHSIAFDILGTDISIDLYDWSNGKVKYCDLYIGNEAIRYTGEQAQMLNDAFHARWSDQSKESTVEKEQDLMKKLQQYINSGNEK